MRRLPRDAGEILETRDNGGKFKVIAAQLWMPGMCVQVYLVQDVDS